MIIRSALSIIACSLAFATAGAADPGDDSPRARAARFYAAGLEQPLLELRRGARLLQVCVTRLRKACTKEQRALAANNRTVELLDELTLFSQRPVDDPDVREWRAADLKDAIAGTRARLVRTAGDYDRLAIARYGAAMSTCPVDVDAEKYRASLDALTTVDLRDFQALEGPEYDQARQAIAVAQADASEALRAMPAEDCRAVFKVGQLVMEMIEGKLEPWTREHRRVGNVDREFDFDAPLEPKKDEAPTREVATSIAGNFVTLVATELQLEAFPETAPRIKAIADREKAGREN